MFFLVIGISLGFCVSAYFDDEPPSIIISPGAAKVESKITVQIGYAPKLDVKQFERRSITTPKSGEKWKDYIYIKTKDEKEALALREKILNLLPDPGQKDNFDADIPEEQ